MPNAKDVKIDTTYIKVLSVGDYGTGKSVFASSFPTPGFVFDFSCGIIGYRGLDFDFEQYTKDAKGWVKYETDQSAVIEKVKAGAYKTVIIDDLSSMADLCMERALQIDPARGEDGGALWNRHYKIVKNLVGGKLRQLLDAPCNIVFIAHLSLQRDENTGAIISIDPLLPGQLSIKVPGYFDEVYYHTVRQEGQIRKWVMQTVPIGLFKARSRISGRNRLLPDFIDNNYATLKALMDKAKVA